MQRVPRHLTAGLILAALLSLAPAVGNATDEKGRAHEQMKFGMKAAARGYWLEALMRFERANQLTPNDPHVLNNIAVALEAAGRFEEALAAYQHALAIAPGDRALQHNYKLFKEFYDENVAPPAAKGGEASGEQPAGEGTAGAGEEHDATPH